MRAPVTAEAELSGLLAGTKYEPVRILGRGGMGVVVEATVRGLGRRVAVKVLSPPQGSQVGAFEEDRLRVEAQTLARVESPHVVSVHDIGRTAEGLPYIAMDLLHGCSLSEYVAEFGRLSVQDALRTAKEALLGLSAAHALGVVHRDVKPANIFLAWHEGGGRSWTVKVVDFGVAKVFGAEGGPSPPLLPTGDGFLMGTPRFFSPEHVTQGPFDARTDVYGVGLLLYVMLTGRGPFDEERGLTSLALAAARAPAPPPSRFAPDRIDPTLDALVLRALEKQPGKRYPDAAAFVAAIDAVLDALAQPRPAEPPPQDVRQGCSALPPATRGSGLPPARRATELMLDPSPPEGREEPRTPSPLQPERRGSRRARARPRRVRRAAFVLGASVVLALFAIVAALTAYLR